MSEVGVFRWEGDFGFRFFGSDSKLCCCSELGNKWGVWEEAFAIAAEDSIDLAIVQGMLEVLVLHVMVKVIIEAGVVDSVYIDMAMGSGEWFPEEGIMSLGVGGMGSIEIFQLVAGFRDGQGLPGPVNGGVCGAKPGES